MNKERGKVERWLAFKCCRGMARATFLKQQSLLPPFFSPCTLFVMQHIIFRFWLVLAVAGAPFGEILLAQTNLSITAHAKAQYKVALQAVAQAQRKNPKWVSPRSLRDDTLFMVSPRDWTSGFFAGNLWYLYELTGSKKWKRQAQAFTSPLESEKTNGTTHDLGFKMYGSFGNGYRLTKDPHYRDVLIQSARTLATRFNPQVGCLRSWDHSRDKWDFSVIIDNMMNLELLFWAFRETKDSALYKIAVSHANTTMENHFRPDYSSYHVIGYDPKTGEVKQRHTHQGYSHESAWSRGQSWGLYGFTMCFRETGNRAYLTHAQHIARFLLNHPNLPADLVPYWDYNAPDIPKAPRDASAAAVMAAALYELSTYVPDSATQYVAAADKIIQSLTTHYRTAPGTHYGFLLKHSTGHLPGKHEIDVPLVYADYYYLEALLRQQRLRKR